MRRAVALSVGALLSATTLGLAGCGSSTPASALRPPVSKLCVDVSVPLSGRQSPVGRALLAGIRLQIPVGGVALGAYRVRLCDIRDDAARAHRSPAEAALANATQAAGALNTIAEIGELSGADAQTADAVLAPAGIPLLTPSAPARQTSAPPGVAASPVRSTALYLLPAAATQAAAVREVASWHDCAQRRHRVRRCSVLGADGSGGASRAPLCTGIGATTATAPRYCVTAGPDLASWNSPAQAYGDSAAKLLVSDLRHGVSDGRDIADRGTVLKTLLHSQLSARQSPIGPVRFDRWGAMEADEFSAYAVQPGGGLVQSRTFHAR